jgi:hypothetical protein
MSARDVIVAAIVIFGIGMGMFVINFMMGTTVDSMLGIGAINESESVVTAFEGIDSVTARFDYLVLGVFIALTLGIIITGWFVAGNPIFMFIFFIVTIIGVVISTLLANLWEEVSQASVFGTTITAFPITNNLLINLPIYVAILGFIGLVIMFAKPRFEQ